MMSSIMFMSKWSDLACKIALDATSIVALEENGRKEIDIKRYAKVEKMPGGTIDDSEVLSGIMINKDVVHPKMRRRIENPRILLLDCNLEYKKTTQWNLYPSLQPNNFTWGINGELGIIADMKEYGIWEPYAVKAQIYKTAIETAILLLRIDDIVSGTKKQTDAQQGGGQGGGGGGGGPKGDAEASEGPEA